MNKDKIGIGVITYNRENLFRRCIKSIPQIGEIVVINDGREYDNSLYPSHVEVIQHKVNTGVGIAKNDAFKYLLDKDCEYIFTVEDDILVRQPRVFEDYVKACKVSGIQHFNFGLHSKVNRTLGGLPNFRLILDYPEGVRIGFFNACIGALSFYSKTCLKHVGFMEHPEHTLRIINAGMHPAYWWFADLANIDDLLIEMDSGVEPLWSKSLPNAADYFLVKHGAKPNGIRDTSREEVLLQLKRIQQEYGKK